MQLWLELGLAVLMVPLAAFIHGLGLMAMSKLFRLSDEKLRKRTLDLGSFYLVGVIGLALFAVHALEIGLFAAFYMAVDAAPSLADALFYSASAYTTAGAGADRLPDGWRLTGEVEALLGLLMVGWSTAYLVQKIDKLRE